MATNGYIVPGDEPNFVENGREYHGWRNGLYWFPCDEAEKERYDIFHTLFLVARKQELFSTPPPKDEPGTRILDVGTGTGIWAIDMADRFQRVEVIGTDLVNIQPRSIPPNLRFRIPGDFEGPWSLGQNSFDLIHLRTANGAVFSWLDMYQKIYQHLKPHTGWMEQVEIDYEPRCANGEVPARLKQWFDYLHEATLQGGKSIKYIHSTTALLKAQGYEDIKEDVVRLPFNAWPSDQHSKEVGRWYNLGLCEGLEALSMGPFTRLWKWSAEDVRRLASEMKPYICDKRAHLYHNLHIIRARRGA